MDTSHTMNKRPEASASARKTDASMSRCLSIRSRRPARAAAARRTTRRSRRRLGVPGAELCLRGRGELGDGVATHAPPGAGEGCALDVHRGGDGVVARPDRPAPALEHTPVLRRAVAGRAGPGVVRRVARPGHRAHRERLAARQIAASLVDRRHALGDRAPARRGEAQQQLAAFDGAGRSNLKLFRRPSASASGTSLNRPGNRGGRFAHLFKIRASASCAIFLTTVAIQ